MDTQTMMRNLAWPAALLSMLLLSSCSAPGDSAAGAITDREAAAAQAGTVQPAAPAQATEAPPAVAPLPAPAPTADPKSAPATPMAGPEGKPALPPPSLGADQGSACRVDSDCAIKDAGSCCGYRPVCVNKDTPTFPEKVKASCATDGRVGICGFPAIDGCQCVAGKCKGVPMMENSVPLQ